MDTTQKTAHTEESWYLNTEERPNLNPEGKTATGRVVGWAQWRQAVYAMPHKVVAWAMGNTHDECEANARLIAAAPETAAELERVKAVNAYLELACRWFLAEDETEAGKILTEMGWNEGMGIGGQAFVKAYLESAKSTNARLALSRAEGRG